MCGVGHNEALDRTMSTTGKILFDPVNGKAISDIDSPLLRTSYPQLESNFKRPDVQFCVKECAGGVRDRVLQRATLICRYLLCSSLLSAIEEIKSSLVAHAVPCDFLDLD